MTCKEMKMLTDNCDPWQPIGLLIKWFPRLSTHFPGPQYEADGYEYLTAVTMKFG